jgi:hypothetical protein
LAKERRAKTQIIFPEEKPSTSQHLETIHAPNGLTIHYQTGYG